MLSGLSNKKIIASTLILFCLVSIIFGEVPHDDATKTLLKVEGFEWLKENRIEAEDYAKAMLSGNASPHLEKFTDYTISAQKAFVIFSHHNKHSVLYGYFPNAAPDEFDDKIKQLHWEKIDEEWFVAYPEK